MIKIIRDAWHDYYDYRQQMTLLFNEYENETGLELTEKERKTIERFCDNIDIDLYEIMSEHFIEYVNDEDDQNIDEKEEF